MRFGGRGGGRRVERAPSGGMMGGGGRSPEGESHGSRTSGRAPEDSFARRLPRRGRAATMTPSGDDRDTSHQGANGETTLAWAAAVRVQPSPRTAPPG